MNVYEMCACVATVVLTVYLVSNVLLAWIALAEFRK